MVEFKLDPNYVVSDCLEYCIILHYFINTIYKVPLTKIHFSHLTNQAAR